MPKRSLVALVVTSRFPRATTLLQLVQPLAKSSTSMKARCLSTKAVESVGDSCAVSFEIVKFRDINLWDIHG